MLVTDRPTDRTTAMLNVPPIGRGKTSVNAGTVIVKFHACIRSRFLMVNFARLVSLL